MEKSSRQKKTGNSRSVAHPSVKNETNPDTTFQFVDNRPEAIAQKEIQEIANTSSQVQKTAQLHEMANSPTAPPVQKQENNTGLPDSLKSGMENLSGMSLDDVKVHRNSGKPAQLQAHAYAQGSDIHLGPGQEKHLPHEAWHVVQQKQGRVKPTVQMKGDPSTQLRAGVNVNDDKGLEKEADVMGRKSLSTIQRFSLEHKDNTTTSLSVVQLVGEEDARDLTWREWFWKHKWKFLAGAITIAAAYVLYKKYGGSDIQVEQPKVEPPAPSVESPAVSMEPPAASVEPPAAENHAWPLGKPYTALDKAKGLVSLAPGGGLVVEGLEQIVKGKPDGPALVAEIVKLHPYAWPANIYDNVAQVLSYYSSGKYEIGQTKDLIEGILASAAKAEPPAAAFL
ncbi:DUF4157 domain-containing protein [bacterium]|nr:DUF4157 domain-containing protein [bacterium]